jgi:hypothetical protein
MDKVEALIIRACKSLSQERRLKRIYKSVYYGQFDPKHMLVILIEIAEKYQLIRLRKLVEELNPNNAWKYGGKESNSYEEKACKCLISVIRLTEVSRLPDYPIPAKFRKG